MLRILGMSDPVTSLARYRVKPGREEEFLEIIDRHWADEDASGRAHTHPVVSGIWEAMEPLCEGRSGRSPFEFLDLRRLVHR